VDVLTAAEAIAAAGGGTQFALRFAFSIDGSPPPNAALVVEAHAGLAITVNDASASAADGWWLDRSFARHPIGALLRPGDNLVELAGIVTPDLEIEAIYLTGSFTVRAVLAPDGGSIERMGQRFAGWRVATGVETTHSESHVYDAGTDLVAQGFPHFVGEVLLSREITLDAVTPETRVILVMDQLWAATALVELNGRDAGQMLWPPYEIDLTAQMQPGTNHLGIRLVTSLRNLLGPLRIAGGDDTSIAPATFRDRARQTDSCWLVPLGFAGVRLVVVADRAAAERSSA
jgi:hypothetical protein